MPKKLEDIIHNIYYSLHILYQSVNNRYRTIGQGRAREEGKERWLHKQGLKWGQNYTIPGLEGKNNLKVDQIPFEHRRFGVLRVEKRRKKAPRSWRWRQDNSSRDHWADRRFTTLQEVFGFKNLEIRFLKDYFEFSRGNFFSNFLGR